MNRGFNVYFKEGIRSSAKTFKNKGNYLRYYLFSIVNFLCILFPILYPILDCGKFRMARNAYEENNIQMSKLIKSADNAKNYWTILLTGAMKAFMILGCIILIVLFGGFLALIGFAIYAFAGQEEIFIFMIIPAAIMLLVFLVVLPFVTVPNAYIVDANDGINASKVLFESFHALRKTGKRTLFAIAFIEYLLIYIITLLLVGLSIIPVLTLDNDTGLGLTIILAIISLVIILIVCPIIALGANISRLCLFDDVVTDKFNATKRISGVNINAIRLSPNDPIETKLTALFDGTEDKKQEVEKDIDLLPEINKNETETFEVEKPVDDEANIDINEASAVSDEIDDELEATDEALGELNVEANYEEAYESSEEALEELAVEEIEEYATEAAESLEDALDDMIITPVESTGEVIEEEITEAEMIEGDDVLNDGSKDVAQETIIEQVESEIEQSEVVELQEDEVVEEEVLEPTIDDETTEIGVIEVVSDIVEEPQEEVFEEVLEESQEVIVEEIIEEPQEVIVEEIIEEPQEVIVEEVVEVQETEEGQASEIDEFEAWANSLEERVEEEKPAKKATKKRSSKKKDGE